MKRSTLTTAVLVSALALTACGGDDEDNDGPVGSTEINPGAGDNDSSDQEQDQGDSPTIDTESAESSEASYEQALEDSEELAAEDDFSEYEMDSQEFDGAEDYDEFLEERTVVMERAAEIMTEFRPGDWNKDVAIIRANHLIRESAQQPGIPESPQSGDPAWDAAMECNATAEVRTQVVSDGEDPDAEHDTHSPHREIIAEYRWVDGDEGCELIQPDHYYSYTMSMGDDALITDFSRGQISYDDNDPGLFED